jgi:potassium efflux system protein
VVTIDGVTGVVSRIRIRSTTITDWDRKEYLVPNKEFITGRLLNWTLSDTLNRIVVHVGVAYGSDTEQVREIILRVANEHPTVLEEPKPLVTFESFGDSALNFVLRAYLPTLESRLGTIHDLHSALHRKLADAGIEVPFPQSDLHLRSVPDSLRAGHTGGTNGDDGSDGAKQAAKQRREA